VSFTVSADAYDRFMGRYSIPLAVVFADFAGVGAERRVVDVGCGPGALTTELVRRLGGPQVHAVDPSATFVEAMRDRHPDVEVRLASAERLPQNEGVFDAALAQLVVHFMEDPVSGLREMARVVTPGGVVAACVWDFEEGGGPLSLFWDAARGLDHDAPGEVSLPGTRRGHLALLLGEAGLADIDDTALAVDVVHRNFDEWWNPFELGVSPAGAYVASLSPSAKAQLMQECRDLHPEEPFTVTAVAWAARGTVAAR